MWRCIFRAAGIAFLALASMLAAYASLNPDAAGHITVGPLEINLAMQGPSRMGFHYSTLVGRADAGYTTLPQWQPAQGMLPGRFANYRAYESAEIGGVEYRVYDRARFPQRPQHPNQPLPALIERSRHLWVSTMWIHLIAITAWGVFVVRKLRDIDRRRGVGRRGFPVELKAITHRG